MPLWPDIWRVGVVHAPIDDIISKGEVDAFPVTWLPEMPSLQFMADPFGLWKERHLYVFVEAYDYRTRKGHIEVIVLDQAMKIVSPRKKILDEPWHLSYPVIIEEKGEIYMLPEAFRSGRLSLYRAIRFPDQWERVEVFSFPENAIDASPLYYQGQWWMFYTPVGNSVEKQSVLHIATAPELTGPWKNVSHNPVRTSLSSARPGGLPFICEDNTLILPTQDCSVTYGGAIVPLHITHLDEQHFESKSFSTIRATPNWAGRYIDGFHTLAAAGDVTLVDAKKISLSPRALSYDIRRKLRKTLR